MKKPQTHESAWTIREVLVLGVILVLTILPLVAQVAVRFDPATGALSEPVGTNFFSSNYSALTNSLSSWTGNTNLATAPALSEKISDYPIKGNTSAFVFEGDSLTAGYGLSAGEVWASRLMLTPTFAGHGTAYNVALNGATLASIVTDYATQVYPHRPSAEGVDNVYLFVWIGTNDIYNGLPGYTDINDYFGQVEDYIEQATADGFKVIAFTQQPKTVIFPEIASQYNQLMRKSTAYWRLVDIKRWVPFAEEDSSLWQVDEIHFSATGNNLIARMVEQTILAGRPDDLTLRDAVTFGRKSLAINNKVNAQATLDIGPGPSGSVYNLVMGDTGTNSAKSVRIGMRSYNPTNNPVTILVADTSGGFKLGGGTGSGNAFQLLDLYFAATQTTATGTGYFRFHPSGVRVGDVTTPTAKLDVRGSSTSTVVAKINGPTGQSVNLAEFSVNDSVLAYVDQSGNVVSGGVTLQKRTGVQASAPTTGGTVTITQNNRDVLVALTPAGTLATLTITLPSSPFAGQTVFISTTEELTALTIDGGTVIGTVTTLSANGYAGFVFDSASWRRVQ